MTIKSLTSVGLYGGASLNSAVLAMLSTDGVDIRKFIKSASVPYPEDIVSAVRALSAGHGLSYAELEKSSVVRDLSRNMSVFYASCIRDFCGDVVPDCIGIDGLTILSDPQNGCSYQPEDGRVAAAELKHDVITHFHKADLLSGGQAAPLSAAFFDCIGRDIPKPVLFIDIETVCSLTYIGDTGEVVSFDCAPGTALIEDWTYRHAGMQTDYNGKAAALGKPHPEIVNAMLRHKFLRRKPPKSLDVFEFGAKSEHLEGLPFEDGAAAATDFIAEAVFQSALDFLPAIPRQIYICGEGLKNPTLVRRVKHCFLPREARSLKEINPFADAAGAQITAFNAARRIYGLPLTFPNTTGVREPVTGGEIYEYRTCD